MYHVVRYAYFGFGRGPRIGINISVLYLATREHLLFQHSNFKFCLQGHFVTIRGSEAAAVAAETGFRVTGISLKRVRLPTVNEFGDFGDRHLFHTMVLAAHSHHTSTKLNTAW